ncbi:MAG: type I-E CRISPR-associated protein Cas5/CasD [Nitrospirota bacterium]
MREFLILKLHGPMQAWGGHTFEGIRPSANFPTRSGLLGLLGACLGIRRHESTRLQQLADGIRIAVRQDDIENRPIVKVTDYHTVKDARAQYAGLKSHETIQTWREYLYDAQFTAAFWMLPTASFTLNDIEAAVRKPSFTPYLGRRSCPLSRPLFEQRVEAATPQAALSMIAPHAGTIYSEEGDESMRKSNMRDVPLYYQSRLFAERDWYVSGGSYVSE